MNPLTHEWVEKAEGDFATAGREMRARKAPNYDAVCFHAQQCGEKYLKALLQEANIPFGRTHNLIALLHRLLPVAPSLEILRPHLQRLNGFAVNVRYPGEIADKATAREALALCRAIRGHARARWVCSYEQGRRSKLRRGRMSEFGIVECPVSTASWQRRGHRVHGGNS